MEERAITYASNRVITASEVGSYLYCNRSWWLDKIGGHEQANVEELAWGTTVHEEHGQQVERAESLNRFAVALMASALLLIFVWIVLQVL